MKTLKQVVLELVDKIDDEIVNAPSYGTDMSAETQARLRGYIDQMRLACNMTPDEEFYREVAIAFNALPINPLPTQAIPGKAPSWFGPVPPTPKAVKGPSDLPTHSLMGSYPWGARQEIIAGEDLKQAADKSRLEESVEGALRMLVGGKSDGDWVHDHGADVVMVGGERYVRSGDKFRYDG